MADRLLDGKLIELLREQREQGLSFDEISRRLFAEHEIEFTGQTLRNWLMADDDAAADTVEAVG